MDKLDRHIINRLQKQLPICDRPYQVVANELGTTESELIHRLKTMLEDGTLTRFGPLFNAAEMGGALSLCAMKISEHKFEQIADAVNHLPQVAHNYERNHELNMWFVLATNTTEELEQTLEKIEDMTGQPVYNFPKKEEFFIGLYLEV